MNGPPLIKVRNLHKHFGANHVLRGIDFEVATGEVLVIIGPSGSGKSTLLRCINFLEDYDEGEIWFVDAVIRMVAEGRPVAVVPLTTGTWYTVGDPASFAAATLAALSLSPALPVSSAG